MPDPSTLSSAVLPPPAGPAPFDFTEARDRMVDGQIRPNKVIDRRILDAMRSLPRERFLPAGVLASGQAARAYADENLPLGGGRYLIQPMVLARLAQLGRPLEGERALVIGAGTGYGAAVLASCGLRVTALEDDAALREVAAAVLSQVAPGIEIVAGPLAAGWPGGAPFDLVFIEGGVTEIPPAIDGQVNPQGGRLVGVMAMGRDGRGAILAEPSQGRLRAQLAFDCVTPLLPQLQAAPGFVF